VGFLKKKSKLAIFGIGALIVVVLTGIAIGTILITNNPDFDKDPAFYKSLGNELVKRGKYAEAVKAYEQSLNMQEDDNLRSNLAIIYYQNAQYTQAIGHLNSLVVMYPSVPSYHYDLAINLVDRFRYTNEKNIDDLYLAMSEYETAEKLEPGFENAAENIEVLKKVLGSS
jgi:tetratricopeptide (TPR) repeat protein